MDRTRIKMCGTTSWEDASVAVSAGVDALGFIFFPKSPRNVDVEKAREIISKLPPFVDSVGVFVDKPVEEVISIVQACGLNHIQLHGKEDADYCLQLKERLYGCKIYKAFRVAETFPQTEVDSYTDAADGILLDTYAKGQEGGTGKTFSWQILENAKLSLPLILAGGLTPENVVDAIKVVKPYAIDINSGVELSPGKKDHTALKRLIGRVRLLEQGNI